MIEALPPAENGEEPLTQPVEMAAAWSSEAPASAIETASLPAFAGDGEMPPMPMPPIPMPPVPMAAEQPAAAPAATAMESLPLPPLAEAEEGVLFPGEGEEPMPEVEEPVLELSQPPLPVQTITEKPASPRRGWWQRVRSS